MDFSKIIVMCMLFKIPRLDGTFYINFPVRWDFNKKFLKTYKDNF